MRPMCSKQFLSYFLILLLLFLSACGGDKKEAGEKAKEAPATSTKAKEIKGQVFKVIDGGSFTFILLDRGDKKTWATVPPVDVKVGEDVTLMAANEMENFYSSELNRTFDAMIFSSGVEGKKTKKQIKRNYGPDGIMTRRSMRLHAAAKASKAIGQEER